MQQPMSFLSFMLWLVGNLACFVIILLVLRYAAKLNWLTSVCLSLLVVQALSLFGLTLFPRLGLMKTWIYFLPAAVCVVILSVQFFRWASSPDDATVNAAERERILQMVENGKISTEEGSELLDAMGRSSALRGQEKFSRLDIVMLVGAALVILGFFLPWINIQSVTQMFGRISAYQAGYQVGAIGWAIFIIGILSAVPMFVTPKDFLYKISMLQIFLILIGVVLVIIVLARAGSNLGAGIIFCLVGFVVELVAAGAKFRKLAA